MHLQVCGGEGDKGGRSKIKSSFLLGEREIGEKKREQKRGEGEKSRYRKLCAWMRRYRSKLKSL